jgi:hypothetical protein
MILVLGIKVFRRSKMGKVLWCLLMLDVGSSTLNSDYQLGQ